MGKCASKQTAHPKNRRKQNKDIDDRKVFKVGFEVCDKEGNVQLGYSRKAKKNYTDVVVPDHTQSIEQNIVQNVEQDLVQDVEQNIEQDVIE